jgi:uncharacterized membrane protein
MFKFLGSLALIFALTVPSFATGHCNQRIVERVIANDYGYNAQAIVLVPHQNFVVERIVQDYDYQPVTQIVERIVQRERVVNRPHVVERVVQAPAKVVERVVERVQERPVRVRQKIVKRNVVVREEVQVQKVIKNRNVQRIRTY